MIGQTTEAPVSNAEPSMEQQIQRRIEMLRLSLPQVGYRTLAYHVSWVLFLEFNLVPTANYIRRQVKRGSLTTCSGGVKRFWDDVRMLLRQAEAERFIPAPLADQVSRSVEALWHLALVEAGKIDSGGATTPLRAIGVIHPLAGIASRLATLEAENSELRRLATTGHAPVIPGLTMHDSTQKQEVRR